MRQVRTASWQILVVVSTLGVLLWLAPATGQRNLRRSQQPGPGSEGPTAVPESQGDDDFSFSDGPDLGLVLATWTLLQQREICTSILPRPVASEHIQDAWLVVVAPPRGPPAA
ncbi:MAG: hypothetical protein ABIJ09_04585 [Pseudomonadota bacterium]